MDDEREEWRPLHVAFGKGPIPLYSAKIIRDAIEEMRKRGQLGATAPIWLGIEYWAADYLAGVGRKVDITNDVPIQAAMSAMDEVLDYLMQEVGNDRAFEEICSWVAARRTADLETRGQL